VILLDSNIIIDLLNVVDTPATIWSRQTYARSVATDVLGCNHVIVAEVAAGARRPDDLASDLEGFQIETLPFTQEAALTAGKAFAAYRKRGGNRQSILADFLIAGHAQVLGATLMTRDRRLATYFPDLTLITPETHP
jgi:predicted nucleic acid-binding protein